MVRFRILGPLEVWTGQDWSGIGAPKWRALLTVLLLSAGQVVPMEKLIDEVWTDAAPSRATNAISIYVLRLRALIGDPHGQVLVTRAPGYQLRIEPDDLDVLVFERMVTDGRRVLADGRAAEGAGALADALALWKGPALADAP